MAGGKLAKLTALAAKARAAVARARKTAVTVATLLGQVVAFGLLDGTALHYAQLALGLATVLGVYGVKNAEKPAD